MLAPATPTPQDNTWIFGYGSLMWNPGFPFIESCHAILSGYHRALCIYSVHYRGTRCHPGLVLGLDRGGQCEGIAFRISDRDRADVIAYLQQRELIYGVYRETHVPLVVRRDCCMEDDHEAVYALTYIAERAHPAYAGKLTLNEQVQLIRRAQGVGGTNLDYVLNTRAKLAKMQISERELERLCVLTSAFARNQEPDDGHRVRTKSLAQVWSQRPVRCKKIMRDNRFSHRSKISARPPHKPATNRPKINKRLKLSSLSKKIIHLR